VLIVDTGPLVATADRTDRDHAACRTLLEGDEGPLVTTAMVSAEAAYLIDRQLGAKGEASLYASIIEGQLEVASLAITDWQRIRDLVGTYADLRLAFRDELVQEARYTVGNEVVKARPLGRDRERCSGGTPSTISIAAVPRI
jgi:uncharacterized protein